MKGVLALVSLVIALALAPYGTAGTGATVPPAVRVAIIHSYPAMAWIPGRLPNGYHFASWTHSKSKSNFGYQLTFVNRSTSPGGQFAFQVIRRACPAAPSWPSQGSFRVNGNTIKWSRTNTDTYAWRCVNSARPFVIFGENGPVRTLAYVVGYARPAN